MVAKTRRPRFVSLVFVGFLCAGIVRLGGVIAATVAGRWGDVDHDMPYALAYLALLIAIDARWPRLERGDDREGPPVKGDTT